MYKILSLNKISAHGLDVFDRDNYEIASEMSNPDAVLVRSADMNGKEIAGTIKAIARAGAGVNNIPVDKCTQKGIVVFNTPGANANGVKELVIAALFLGARKIVEGVNWAKTLIGKGDEVPDLIEKGKGAFTGPEILGKKLGVIGLGAIGGMVANSALALGMEVIGFDSFISIESAWTLSKDVKPAKFLDTVITESDYITIHVPLNDKTKGIINKARFENMKKGVCLLNFSRNGIVNNNDLKDAIQKGIVSCYITDFPDEELLKMDKVICLPHLGASTPESEDNCAFMAASQLKNFLEHGSIKNSVNFPDCEMPFSGRHRLVIANQNIPNMVGQITTILAEEKINIADMLNRHKDKIAYNIIDVDSDVSEKQLEKLSKIEGVIMVRLI